MVTVRVEGLWSERPVYLPVGRQGGNKTSIDVSPFPSGVYVVEVKTEKRVAVKKFVKE